MCHVLIIGAGPAGTSCAIKLLKAGVSVTILDRQTFPRHVPGETLHPGIEVLLKQLDVLENVEKANFMRHQGIISCFKQQKEYEPYNAVENWLGFHAVREAFDTILMDKAILLGAKFFDQCKGLTISKDEDRITSIHTYKGEFRANYYIDASGRNSLLNRRLKIGYHYNSPTLIAYYGYVNNKQQGSIYFENPQIIWDDKGWTWIAKVTDDLICWNRLNFSNEKLTQNWLPSTLHCYERLKPARAVDVTWRIAKYVSCSNYFLVGDAAFVLDPASSHGVIKAIMSGMMVGYLIERIKLGQISQFTAREYYNDWIESWYWNDVKQLKALYKNKGFHTLPSFS
jgi:flavin-dependent dehydrogenase